MEDQKSLPEHWQRGPVDGVPPLLQPVAHTLLQAMDEIQKVMENFPLILLWERPAGMASPAFHVQHIAGVLDRLFTYADNKQLSIEQMQYLKAEGKQDNNITIEFLSTYLKNQVINSIEHLKNTDQNTLTEFRGVGRKQLPSTVIGLLFHAAEHTMRHTGQLIVTVNVLKGGLINRNDHGTDI